MTIRALNPQNNYPSQQRSEGGNGIVNITIDPDVLKQRMEQLQRFVKEYMKDGEDYGVITGINKPTLYKSGAEKLCDVYGLSAGEPTIDYTRDDSKSPVYISYRVIMPLISRIDGRMIMTGVGSCNSHEKKYKWRWVFENELPSNLNPQHLKSKQVGKNKQYTQYQIPNDEVDDLDNTILKMAKKRALVDAVLSATRSSAMFTQDVEDMEEIKQKNEHAQDKRYEQRRTQTTNNQNKNNNGPATENQLHAIKKSADRKGLNEEELTIVVKVTKKVEDLTKLTFGQASELITYLNKAAIDELNSIVDEFKKG